MFSIKFIFVRTDYGSFLCVNLKMGGLIKRNLNYAIFRSKPIMTINDLAQNRFT